MFKGKKIACSAGPFLICRPENQLLSGMKSKNSILGLVSANSERAQSYTLGNNGKKTIVVDKDAYDNESCIFTHVGCSRHELNGKARRRHMKNAPHIHLLQLSAKVQKIQSLLDKINQTSQEFKGDLHHKVGKYAMACVKESLSECQKDFDNLNRKHKVITLDIDSCIRDLKENKCNISKLEKEELSHGVTLMSTKVQMVNMKTDEVSHQSNEIFAKGISLQKVMNNLASDIGLLESKATALLLMFDDLQSTTLLKDCDPRAPDQQNFYLNTVILPKLPARYHPAPNSEDFVVSYDGVLLWKIPDCLYHFSEAVQKRIPSFYSPPFFSGKSGDKLIARIFLNGDEHANGTHISVNVEILERPYGALLSFDKKITLCLIDQNNIEHHTTDVYPESQPSHSQEYESIYFPCSKFFRLDSLQHRGFIKDDVIFLRISVEPYD